VYLALSERTVRMMLAEQRIPSYKIEGTRRIDADDVDQYLRSCRTAENTGRRY
jgi:excisionase family DNA binding protein